MAAPAEAASCPAAALPTPLLVCVLSLLPADCRLLCRGVCAAWRDAAADASLWRRLDLSSAAGLTHAVTDGMLAAAARHGELEALDVSGALRLSPAGLLRALAAHAGTLRTLRVCDGMEHALRCDRIEALLRAAPRLAALHADAYASDADARRMLRRAPPFGPLRLRELRVAVTDGGAGEVLDLASAVATHGSLRGLMLSHAPLDDAAVLDAVLDAAVAARLRALRFDDCGLGPESCAALGRLLATAPSLTELEVSGGFTRRHLLGVDGSEAPLCAALRGNSTLTSLSLVGVNLWRTAGATRALLHACKAHASIRTLDLSHNHAPIEHRAFAGSVLAALLEADARALTCLRLTECWLGAPGLGSLCNALLFNSHLEELALADNRMSDALLRSHLLPALAANRALRVLAVASEEDTSAAKREAEAMVAARGSSF